MNALEVAEQLKITLRQLNDYVMGYHWPSHIESERLLTEAAQLIPEAEWDNLVISTIFADLDRCRPGLIQIDSAKADAIVCLSTHVSTNRQQTDEFQKLKWRLLNMEPYK